MLLKYAYKSWPDTQTPGLDWVESKFIQRNQDRPGHAERVILEWDLHGSLNELGKKK